MCSNFIMLLLAILFFSMVSCQILQGASGLNFPNQQIGSFGLSNQQQPGAKSSAIGAIGLPQLHQAGEQSSGTQSFFQNSGAQQQQVDGRSGQASSNLKEATKEGATSGGKNLAESRSALIATGVALPMIGLGRMRMMGVGMGGPMMAGMGGAMMGGGMMAGMPMMGGGMMAGRGGFIG